MKTYVVVPVVSTRKGSVEGDPNFQSQKGMADSQLRILQLSEMDPVDRNAMLKIIATYVD